MSSSWLLLRSRHNVSCACRCEMMKGRWYRDDTMLSLRYVELTPSSEHPMPGIWLHRPQKTRMLPPRITLALTIVDLRNPGKSILLGKAWVPWVPLAQCGKTSGLSMFLWPETGLASSCKQLVSTQQAQDHVMKSLLLTV